MNLEKLVRDIINSTEFKEKNIRIKITNKSFESMARLKYNFEKGEYLMKISPSIEYFNYKLSDFNEFLSGMKLVNDKAKYILLVLHELGHIDYLENKIFKNGKTPDKIKNFNCTQNILKYTIQQQFQSDDYSKDELYRMKYEEIYADRYAYKNFFKIYNMIE